MASSTTRSSGLFSCGVYISYPFCDQKCTYCNFASGVFSKDLEARYQRALIYQLEQFEWPCWPDTVYFGGGTPARMPVEVLEKILALIPGRPWAEGTLEVAPGNLPLDVVRAWARMGITRVSLGVQSFVARELAYIGRKHTAELVEQNMEVLRRVGIQNINIDLIAGLPYQTFESWNHSLEWIERLAPPHVSVYILEIDEKSRLGREVLNMGNRYGARHLPSEDEVVEFYEMACHRLAELGIYRYEISNFARPGWESKHNLKYWRLEPYFGFGADAHSFDGSRRWWTVMSPGEFVERIEHNQSPIAGCEEADVNNERFLLGLRLEEGVKIQAGEADRLKRLLDDYVEAGLVSIDAGTVKLTPRGFLVANEVLQVFVGA